jgi:hypothetical protein
MPPLQSLSNKLTRTSLAIALLSAIGCGSAAPPETKPADLEKIRTEMKATSNRELSGGQ